MDDLNIRDNDYWESQEILADEVGNITECTAQRVPWYPADAGQFDWARGTYRNWHPEDAESYLMAFPWPEPGEFPNIPQRYFVPTEKARAKIQCSLITSYLLVPVQKGNPPIYYSEKRV
jgi:hypothetical protein